MKSKTPSVLIVGLGLIGASLGKALVGRNLAQVYGFDLQEGVSTTAQELGAIHTAVHNAEDLSQIDVVVLAVPVLAIAGALSNFRAIAQQAKAVTDVGSVKGEVVRQVQEAFGEVPANIVPGHPIAGAEKSGVFAANPDLFDKHLHILTPLAHTSEEAVESVQQLWSSCGAEIVTMTVERHDEVLAATSHLPHLLAFSLVDTLARESENYEIFKYAAGGFRDFSRIAASDPTMWHDVFLANKDATLKILRRFQSDLQQLESAIEHDNGDLLKTVFRRAKSARDYFTELLSRRSI